MSRTDNAFPSWHCSGNHVNDLLRGTCRNCGEHRPCDRCGSKSQTSLSATAFECAECRKRAPALRPSSLAEQEEARRALREDVLACARAEENALYAKNRRKPPEAYLAHTFTVLEAVRPAQGDVLPTGIRALVKRCEETGATYELSKTLATDTDGFGTTRYVESVCFRAAGVFVAYENGAFVRALGNTIPGRGTLTDAKRALGIAVADRKPRTKRDPQTASKPAGKTDTLR